MEGPAPTHILSLTAAMHWTSYTSLILGEGREILSGFSTSHMCETVGGGEGRKIVIVIYTSHYKCLQPAVL